MIHSDGQFIIREATKDDLTDIQQLLNPFVEQHLLLPRTPDDLAGLLQYAFTGTVAGQLIGFAAIEIYSQKLAEIQCLAVDTAFHGQGIGKQLVANCVNLAKQHNILEVMAISASDEFLKQCGFDYSLPDQKRALFYPTDRPNNDEESSI
ncbi:MAG: GNAT family N-acetyltransferase [Pirellulales bacterium]|nr:GNAT family N-acetyltransferase [Pirellulales bacterium]